MINYKLLFKRYNRSHVWKIEDFENFWKEWDDVCEKLRRDVIEDEHE